MHPSAKAGPGNWRQELCYCALSLTAKLYLGWFLLINVLFVDGTVDEALTPADGQVLDRSGGPPEM